ncbi:alpha/beta hydrolase [Belliella sp. DSM 111904]|uniref:Alpha/beta hydrolase n=1 Tax=Belliella filtrata TaxID=2923435 RepID=A0ABS9V030_9BACT|nr:alpha/beta hydrolase [Belliella filtrata]MCH7409360.1 alpha/beta hydrolase [Belliella filtrata]
MRELLFITLIFFVFCFNVYSQRVENTPLWDKEAPYTKKSIRNDQVNERGNVQVIANPDLTIYFPKKNKTNLRSILICPGGGYSNLAINHEGHEIAKFYADNGYIAAVLKYRLPEPEFVNSAWEVPLADAKQAIKVIRNHSEDWSIDPTKVGVLGFSAGGHLASSLSVHGTDDDGSRPDFSLLIYPVISMDSSITHAGSRRNLLREMVGTEWEFFHSNELQVDQHTPPAFLVHSWDDKVVPVENSIRYAKALNAYDIPVTLHLFEKGGHGYGRGNIEQHGTASQWIDLSLVWLDQILK